MSKKRTPKEDKQWARDVAEELGLGKGGAKVIDEGAPQVRELIASEAKRSKRPRARNGPRKS